MFSISQQVYQEWEMRYELLRENIDDIEIDVSLAKEHYYTIGNWFVVILHKVLICDSDSDTKIYVERDRKFLSFFRHVRGRS